MNKEELKQKFYKKSNLAVPSMIWNWFDRNIITPLESEISSLKLQLSAESDTACRLADLNDQYESESTALKDELSKEREKHRWIPVTELLPNKDEYVLVYSTQMGIHEDKFTGLRINGQPEFYGNREEYDMGVTHWQTLPSPPNHNTKSLNNE
jgi:hypothetical protein